jgi:hypothetical protein
MNFRLALLLCGSFLIAMGPACRADGVTSFGHAEISPTIEVSARTTGYLRPELNAPDSARFMAYPVFRSSMYGDIPFAVLRGIDSQGRVSSNPHAEDVWLPGKEREQNRKHRRDEGVYTAVPESGTLGYLLLGLVGLGFLAFRRSAWMRPI